MKIRFSFTIVEVILAMGLFALVVGGGVGAAVRAFSLNRLGEEESYAHFLANEGLEASRSISSRDYFNLANGSYGLSSSPGQWEFSGSSDTFGKFTRTIVISNVYRSVPGNDIVSSGGVLDIFTKRVESRVAWDFAPARSNEVSLKTYFTFWEATICEWDTALIQVGGLNLPGPTGATDIEIADNSGYVTALKNSQGEEFYVLSLTDPLNPQIAGSYEVGSDVNAVAVSDSFAYLATASAQELIVLNVSNPNSPTLAGGSGLPGAAALDVVVLGDYAYLGLKNNNGPEFYIYNISTPSSPTLAGSFEVGKDVPAISVSGDRAYLAATATGQSDAKSLIVVDISNPASPLELGSYRTELAGAKGQSVYYAGGVVHLTTAANAGSIPEYYILDASDPANISLIGFLDVQHAVNSVETGTGFALLATDTNSKAIMLVDITPPTSPTEIFSLPLGGSGIGTAINGCYVYVASTDNNQEITVATPE